MYLQVASAVGQTLDTPGLAKVADLLPAVHDGQAAAWVLSAQQQQLVCVRQHDGVVQHGCLIEAAAGELSEPQLGVQVSHGGCISPALRYLALVLSN